METIQNEVKKMARYSEAQNEASKRYQKKVYDNIRFRVPKGYREKILKPLSEITGESVNSFIRKAVDEKILRDGLDLPIDEYKP